MQPRDASHDVKTLLTRGDGGATEQRKARKASNPAHTHLPAVCRRCLVLDLDPLPRPLHPAFNTTSTKQSKASECLISTEDGACPTSGIADGSCFKWQMQRCSMAAAIMLIELTRLPGSLRRTCHVSSSVGCASLGSIPPIALPIALHIACPHQHAPPLVYYCWHVLPLPL